MTDAPRPAARAAAITRLKRADGRVKKHEHERKELSDAIEDARRIGLTPTQIKEVVHYDRNHIGRILKEAGLTEPRTKKTGS